MEYDRFGIPLNWKRPEMDLPEMDRFQMPEMDYLLGTKIKIKIKGKQGLREDDRWGHPVIHTHGAKQTEKEGGELYLRPQGIKPGMLGCNRVARATGLGVDG